MGFWLYVLHLSRQQILHNSQRENLSKFLKQSQVVSNTETELSIGARLCHLLLLFFMMRIIDFIKMHSILREKLQYFDYAPAVLCICNGVLLEAENTLPSQSRS